MLRISEAPADGKAILRLEGQVSGPWVQELRAVAEGWLGRGYRLCLDLEGVSFADATGVTLLRDLLVREVSVRGASPFVAELLGGAKR